MHTSTNFVINTQKLLSFFSLTTCNFALLKPTHMLNSVSLAAPASCANRANQQTNLHQEVRGEEAK